VGTWNPTCTSESKFRVLELTCIMYAVIPVTNERYHVIAEPRLIWINHIAPHVFMLLVRNIESYDVIQLLPRGQPVKSLTAIKLTQFRVRYSSLSLYLSISHTHTHTKLAHSICCSFTNEFSDFQKYVKGNSSQCAKRRGLKFCRRKVDLCLPQLIFYRIKE
jgi:hypothetical protein